MQSEKQPERLLTIAEVAPDFIDKKSVFGILTDRRDEIFPPELIDPIFAPSGQPSTSGSVICSALLLEALYRLSDRESVDRMMYNMLWISACGFALGQKVFHYTTLVYWRNRIATSDNPQLVFGAVPRIVQECGAFTAGGRRVKDSTVINDAVARQDTYALIISKIANMGQIFPRITEKVDNLPGGEWYRDRLLPDIDWTRKSAVNDFVSKLLADAATVAGWAQAEIDKMNAPENDRVRVAFCDEVGLLGVLSGQNVQPAPGSDGTDGRWRIRSA